MTIENKDLDLEKELDEMLDMIQENSGVEDSNNNNTEEVKNEESEEVSETSEETETTEVKEETKEEEEEDELTLLKKQNQLLLEQLGAMTPVVEEKKEEEEIPEVDEKSFIGDWKFDDIIASEDSFKEFLGTFAKQIVEKTEERLLKKLPGTVTKLTTERLNAQNTVKSFYAEHKQLSAVKPFMAKVVTTVASEHADWDLETVLEESAKRAYKALGLKQEIAGEKKSKEKKPAFAGPAKGNNRGGDKTSQKSELEKELEELMDLE